MRMGYSSLILKSLDDQFEKRVPAASKSKVNSDFVAGQRLSGSLVPLRASIVTPHCTKHGSKLFL
jgi:hypothetical protein